MGIEPLLQLQAAAGNSAVTRLVRGGMPATLTAAVTVQRLWDTDEGEGDGGASGEGPAPADAEPAGDFGAAEAEVAQVLDPATVTGTLSILEPSERQLGDFPTPDNGPTAQAMRIQRDGPEEPPPPRPGTPGDVIKALKPYLEPALKFLEENVLAAIRKIKAGEAVATIVIAAPIIVGPLTQPEPRKLVLDQLDNTDVTFGLIPNLQLKPQIVGGELKGATLTYDLAPALRKAGIPF